MDETLIFGYPEPYVQYRERRAAYVVIVADDGKIAMVRGRQKYFLPGGGSAQDEAPEDTILREAREELARSVRLTRKVGEAVQYFYSATDDCHYKMLATFFAGEFTDAASGATGEHELAWLPSGEAERACFHACHAWAIRRA